MGLERWAGSLQSQRRSGRTAGRDSTLQSMGTAQARRGGQEQCGGGWSVRHRVCLKVRLGMRQGPDSSRARKLLFYLEDRGVPRKSSGWGRDMLRSMLQKVWQHGTTHLGAGTISQDLVFFWWIYTLPQSTANKAILCLWWVKDKTTPQSCHNTDKKHGHCPNYTSDQTPPFLASAHGWCCSTNYGSNLASFSQFIDKIYKDSHS